MRCLQEKVHKELDSVVGRYTQPRLEHSGDLHYVNAVLAETLRKASVAPSGLPHYVTGVFHHGSSIFRQSPIFSLVTKTHILANFMQI